MNNNNVVLKEQLNGISINKKVNKKTKAIFRLLNWFQGVSRLFVLSFEDEKQGKGYKRYYLPTVEIKNYNVMIDGQKVFDQLVKNDLRTFDSIPKIAPGQGDDCTTPCLLDYNYFIDNYKIIAIDLSKHSSNTTK